MKVLCKTNILTKSAEQKTGLISARERIQQYCSRASDNLNNNTFQDKRQALDAFYVQLIATPEMVKIRIAVLLEFITIEQTSTCMFIHNKYHKPKVSAVVRETVPSF
jgi:hypothetical protein